MNTLSLDVSASRKAGRYDPAERKQGKRGQRERGCWVYIAADELAAAGFDPHGPAALLPRARLPAKPERRFGHRLAVPRAMSRAMHDGTVLVTAVLALAFLLAWVDNRRMR